MSIEIVLTCLILALALRTFGWHLRCWQIREYRFDRMRAWLNTKDGRQYFVPWCFRGLLPRPRLSGRIGLIVLSSMVVGLEIALLLSVYPLMLWNNCNTICHALNDKGVEFLTLITCYEGCEAQWFFQPWFWVFVLFLWERTIWLQVLLGVAISKFPVWLGRRRVFNQAHRVMKRRDSWLRVIGITGSYGKSSTKEILVHLLHSEFGEHRLRYNPANENNEVAIARLIKKEAKFMTSGMTKDRFFVCEMGAYRAGDIAQMCCFTKPCYGILTGLNQQHVELFGSFDTIKNTKFELAESAGKTVWFNADNLHLQQIFSDRKITATPVPLSLKMVKNLKSFPDRTEFELYGERFVLPWPGEFFVQNALLALECAREMGIKPKALSKHLKSLPPLERALNLTEHAQGFHVLRDTYSANLDGVLQALAHLKHFKGERMCVAMPLRELGDEAEEAHRQVFAKLKTLKAEVWWEKSDFADLGQEILGEAFHPLNTKADQAAFKKKVKSLQKGDVVLLESKLSATTLQIFT